MTSSHDPESSAHPDPRSRRSSDSHHNDDPADPADQSATTGPNGRLGAAGEFTAAEPAEPAVREALEAGFTHRYGGHGTGFTAGGPLDVMLPGPDLARHIGQARQRGLGALSDESCAG